MYEYQEKMLLNYIDTSIVKSLKSCNGIIAGGAITSIFNRKKINDVDIYFRNRIDCASFIHEAIEESCWIIAKTNKAVLFVKDEVKYQVIYFDYFSSAEELFGTFDFTVCMGAYDFKKEEFILHENFLLDNTQKILRFNVNTAFPIISALRVDKYKTKGYYISKPEFINIILACTQLDLSTIDKIEEQIGGMYGYDVKSVLGDIKDFTIYDLMEKIQSLESDSQYSFSDLLDLKTPIDRNTINVENLYYEIYGVENLKFVINSNNDVYIEENVLGRPTITFTPDREDLYSLENVIVNAQNAKDIFKGYKFYKFVNIEANGTYSSIRRKNFIYEIGKIVTPEEKEKDDYFFNPCAIYVFHKHSDRFGNFYSENRAMLELEIESLDDLQDLSQFGNYGEVRLKKAKVVRQVPVSEYIEFDYFKKKKGKGELPYGY